MRVALIADIHGNALALEQVLADIQHEQVDQIICLGDVAIGSPQPHETLRLLQELRCPVVMGNADEDLLLRRPLPGDSEDTRKINAINFWCAEQVSSQDLAYVQSFQPTVSLNIEGASLLCFHGSPRSNEEIIEASTTEDALISMYEGHEADLLAGGHTHVQLFRRHRNTIVLNPGSVGLPFTYSNRLQRLCNPAWAEYAIVAMNGGQLSVDLRRVPIDVDKLKHLALASGMPYAEWWCSDWQEIL